jgi:hypothetical protein
MHEVYALNLKDSPRLQAPEYRVEPKMTAHDEEVNRWIGVFIAMVGVTLIVLSALEGVPF